MAIPEAQGSKALLAKMAAGGRVGEERPGADRRGPGLIVRPYRPGDFRRVRRIFVDGMTELATPAFKRSARAPSNVCLLLASGGTVYTVTASLAWAGLACLAFLALVYLAGREHYAGYVRERLRTDMADIEGHYLKPPGAGFWVAEVEAEEEEEEEEEEGRVVGTVAAKMSPGDPSSCELFRLSIDRRYRRHGLGARLTRKVLEFARAHGYRVCVLETTDVQEPAIKLYQKLGFCVRSSRPGPAHPILQLLNKVSICKLEQRL
ncbi:probable N-acetyltransferase CML1 isoform X2 [Heptranchias perlo]|uniref:probable N-acetyltransferase CML1 isoform X2 n=1 Tax=Heptranchias perlo TaxID=212740 RepID=UPI00355AA8E5